MTRLTRNLFALLVTTLAIGAFSFYAHSQTHRTNFKTMIPHRNAIPGVNVGGPVGMEIIPATFSGSPYSVGPTITPTTSVPEAEEHIAVDPNNFNNLVAMISDFSLRGGFNTSKFASSGDDGSSWNESFVPLSGGFPATADGHVWQANSDPVVAIDLLGNVYLENLYLQVDSAFNVTNDGLYVCVATLA